jgi:hypothetical protein
MVLATIQLNNQSRLHADEIHDIGTDRLLTSEFMAHQLAVTQTRPKHSFHVGLVRTKDPGAFWLL